jgi:hypothetical protein
VGQNHLLLAREFRAGWDEEAEMSQLRVLVFPKKGSDIKVKIEEKLGKLQEGIKTREREIKEILERRQFTPEEILDVGDDFDVFAASYNSKMMVQSNSGGRKVSTAETAELKREWLQVQELRNANRSARVEVERLGRMAKNIPADRTFDLPYEDLLYLDF